MKLTELATPKKSRQISKVFESYFETKMPVNQITAHQAQTMLNKVRGAIAEHQRSSSRHTSERNPAYLKLVMMEQALASRIRETVVSPTPGGPLPPEQAQQQKQQAQQQQMLGHALQKVKQGVRVLSPTEQALVNQ